MIHELTPAAIGAIETFTRPAVGKRFGEQTGDP